MSIRRVLNKKDRNRKYYGCRHCGSWCVTALKSCIGDREGIRSDYKCSVCGGVYGTAAHGYVSIDERDWEDETGESMPKPNKERVLAMKILVVLEEQFGFRFRSKELKVVEAVTPLIVEHHRSLLKRHAVAHEKLKKIGSLAYHS